jgi:hypothetical protein
MIYIDICERVYHTIYEFGNTNIIYTIWQREYTFRQLAKMADTTLSPQALVCSMLSTLHS